LSDTIFEIQNVTYSYDDILALDDVSLTVSQGERIAVLGANGSGKSTFLRLLDGLYFADKGLITAFGEALTDESLRREDFAFSFRQRVALVFQNPDVQLFNPTVFDEIAFGPLQLRWNKEEIRRRVGETMERYGIAHLKDRSPHRLSSGEKKRVALASVLILNPEVLLMDEPTAALDPGSRGQIIDLLSDHGNPPKTVITATHDLDIIEDIADRCFVFQNGRLEATGTPEEVLADDDLLHRTNLIHAHRHRHPGGEFHSHSHIHRFHEHTHEHDRED
jgi:cobalt/nickel transport system ATP-binding protein